MSDWERLHKEAQRLLRRGQPGEALLLYEQLIAQVDAPTATYDSWTAEAERLAVALEQPQLGAYLSLYRRDFATAFRLLGDERWAAERAWVRYLEAIDRAAQAGSTTKRPVGRPAAGQSPSAPTLFAEAAAIFEASGQLVSAAAAFAQADDRAAALRCYRQLLADPRLGGYEQALCHFQLVRLLVGVAGSERDCQRHSVLAQQLLEALADEQEAAGEVDRALDCHFLYIELGRVGRRFENIAEGALGCLRLLRGERRTIDALRQLNALLIDCAEFGEESLAAAECSAAAEELERRPEGDGDGWASHYRRTAGQALARLALRYGQAGVGQAALAESAYLQAIAAYNGCDDSTAIAELWTALAALPLPGESQRRYRQLAVEAASGSSPPAAPPRALPAFLQPSLAERLPVWDLDLGEWQAAGSAQRVCLALVGDVRRPLLCRRHALTVLWALAAPGATNPLAGMDSQRERRMVGGLAGLRCYEALRPLEQLFEQARPPTGLPATASAAATLQALGRAARDPAARSAVANPSPATRLRRAIIEELPRLPFRRSLGLIISGLGDPDLAVYAASLESLSRAHFPEAVSALGRLYGATVELEVRRATLQALGHCHDERALAQLRDHARHAAEPLRSDAQRLLRQAEASGDRGTD